MQLFIHLLLPFLAPSLEGCGCYPCFVTCLKVHGLAAALLLTKEFPLESPYEDSAFLAFFLRNFLNISVINSVGSTLVTTDVASPFTRRRPVGGSCTTAAWRWVRCGAGLGSAAPLVLCRAVPSLAGARSSEPWSPGVRPGWGSAGALCWLHKAAPLPPLPWVSGRRSRALSLGPPLLSDVLGITKSLCSLKNRGVHGKEMANFFAVSK